MGMLRITIDVRKMHVADRPKKVSRELDQIKSGERAEIVSDDERMLKLAPKMMKSIGKAEVVRSWKGSDGFYYTLVEKK